MAGAAVDTNCAEEGHQTPSKSQNKVDVLLKPVGNAPCVRKSKWKVARSDTLSKMVNSLFALLRLDPQEESIFIFVLSSFAPPLDTEIECKILKDFLFTAISVNLFQMKAYPPQAFKSAFVFGTPAMILLARSVRKYVMEILNSLQLSEVGQQELVLRYHHSENGGCCDVIFRFRCLAFRPDTYLNLDFWKEALGSALGRLWLRPPPIFHDVRKGVSWALMVRNWLQPSSACHKAASGCVKDPSKTYCAHTILFFSLTPSPRLP
ncbi:unnamed protein product [Hydatigera taeniaeformis]|uniref:Ubiquitin-like protein ATG12 n=1 Tax=Hydatigena taeniaeformis TaxID=6205 RepID=A0A0R3X3G8_HYDTA|nr:unnamed protein product [Hydatigera taeniaeformis]